MEKNTTIALVVPVFRGAKYLEECVQSINIYGHYFDEILVSINKSESYLNDIKILEEALKVNYKLLVQNREFSMVHHFLKYIGQISSNYVFFLAHDDILDKGVEEMCSIIQQYGKNEDIAIMGSYRFFGKGYNNGLVKELNSYPKGISKNTFFEYDLGKAYSINITGMVTPVRAIMHNVKYIRLFKRGIRLDYLLITNNYINRIYQTDENSVRIRLHCQQQGVIIKSKPRTIDSINYYLYQYSSLKADAVLLKKILKLLVYEVFSSLKRYKIYGLYYFLKYLYIYSFVMGFRKFLFLLYYFLKIFISKILKQ